MPDAEGREHPGADQAAGGRIPAVCAAAVVDPDGGGAWTGSLGLSMDFSYFFILIFD